MRLHNRSTFFKYMSAETAALVLLGRALRWSSPILFNDPFDVPREIIFGIKPQEIFEAGTRHMASLIEHPPDDASEFGIKLKMIVGALKKGITPELKAELLDGLKTTLANYKPNEKSLDEIRQMWRDLLPTFRILCLTESAAHSAMWLHYADRYKGAVLEFACDEKVDSAWLIAKPVAYTDTIPAVYTAEGWAGLLMLEREVTVKKMLDIATYTKSSDWSYEREWRITSFKREGDTGHFTDYEFHTSDLAGIYFGPYMTEADRAALTRLSKAYPRVKLFEVSIGMSRQFMFEEVAPT